MDPCYIFMALYYCERYSLEQESNITGRKGKTEVDENGEMIVNLVDPFDIFKNLKGSPKY